MRTRLILPLALLCLATLIAAGCAAPQRTPPEGPGAAAVSDVEPRRAEFSARPEPLPQLPAVESRGGCEPRYRNGRSGTCVNDRPCRGFGVLEDGQAVCRCFAARGGCAEGYRCDTRGAQCVKDDAGEFNRPR